MCVPSFYLSLKFLQLQVIFFTIQTILNGCPCRQPKHSYLKRSDRLDLKIVINN
ncbi:hypothetical protein Cabys_3466 [Caldithrix abyssi DSM 13497]|uniref:Uncharacterized protein n=1 Tax=Caldithrix abyssi DSM 13497 TaxID=880073 RepID=A0A1J1CCV5_CALAY|nr:hypothetical protein Cabys_3466 [Caldithrix abyssi DSM 13497]